LVQDQQGWQGSKKLLHGLHAGHISDYLIHWRNLYTHSKQG
jgi:hypothetical protein